MSHPFVLYHLALAEMEDARRRARSVGSPRPRRLRRSAVSPVPREAAPDTVEQPEERVPSLV